MDNLEIWNRYKEVPSNALKDFNNGSFKGTDINTMWRIKSLTEAFGICGIGWYYDIVRTWIETGNNTKETMAHAEIKLYIKDEETGEWSKGISGIGGNKQENYVKPKEDKEGYWKISDECYKMAVTDALGNACRNLGFGADVYWANDKTKYTETKTEAEDDEIIGGEYVLKGGKYDGETIQAVYDKDPDYCKFCALNSRSYKVRANFKKCIEDNGDFIDTEV